jgi:ABC-2 type transport system permease protein
MPPVVRTFADNQPVTSIVEAIRSLLATEPVGNDIWVALVWCVGISIVAYYFAMRVYKRKTA